MGVSAHNPGTVAGVTARTFKKNLSWKGKDGNKVRENRDPKEIQRTQQIDQRENVSDKINGSFTFHHVVIAFHQSKQ